MATAQPQSAQSQSPQAPAPAEPPAGGQAPGGNAAAAQAASAGSPVESQPRDPQQEIAGLRAWLAQMDRGLGVRTYIGAALAVLAVAAAAVALVLTLSLKQDSATQDEVDSLRDQISVVEQSASQAAQSGVQSLNQRLTDLEGQIDKLSADQTTSKRELEVVQDDIKELRSQTGAGSTSGTGSEFGGTDTGTGAAGTGP